MESCIRRIWARKPRKWPPRWPNMIRVTDGSRRFSLQETLPSQDELPKNQDAHLDGNRMRRGRLANGTDLRFWKRVLFFCAGLWLLGARTPSEARVAAAQEEKVIAGSHSGQ